MASVPRNNNNDNNYYINNVVYAAAGSNNNSINNQLLCEAIIPSDPMSDTAGSDQTIQSEELLMAPGPYCNDNGVVVPYDLSDITSSMMSIATSALMPEYEGSGIFPAAGAGGIISDRGISLAAAAAAAAQYHQQQHEEYGSDECTNNYNINGATFSSSANFWPALNYYPIQPTMINNAGAENWEIQADPAGRLGGGGGGVLQNKVEDPNLKITKYSAQERKDRILRYLKKRSQRNFNKTIKYACRKTLADKRVRIRGRFAKNNNDICTEEDMMIKNTDRRNFQDMNHPLIHQIKAQEEEYWLQEAISNLMYNYHHIFPDNSSSMDLIP